METGALAEQIISYAGKHDRYVVAIAGPPGAGKSTLADALQTNIAAQGKGCAIVPMDGFHLDNRILKARDLLARKGAPETFDANGFLHLIQRLLGDEDEVFIPIFDRNKDSALAGASVVQSKHGILLLEGNYLLLSGEPWCRMATHFHKSIFLDPGIDELKRRLVQRWIDQGYDQEAAERRALDNDIPNAELVLEKSMPADLIINQ